MRSRRNGWERSQAHRPGSQHRWSVIAASTRFSSSTVVAGSRASWVHSTPMAASAPMRDSRSKSILGARRPRGA